MRCNHCSIVVKGMTKRQPNCLSENLCQTCIKVCELNVYYLSYYIH